MVKYIQKEIKTEKQASRNSGKTLGENVEITYNIKRRNETQHLTHCYNNMLAICETETWAHYPDPPK